MIISVSDTFKHKAKCPKKVGVNQEELHKAVLKSIKKVGLDTEDVCWTHDGNLTLKHIDSLKLHTLMLHMEALGLDLKMTKQTLIEIC